MPGCPPGLEYLTQVDQLLVQQKVELLEGMIFEFLIFSILGHLIQNWEESSYGC